MAENRVILFYLIFRCDGYCWRFSGELMKSTYLNMKENQLEDDAKILLQTTNMENLDLDKDAATIQKVLIHLARILMHALR